jgi:hypothetical protein
MHPSFMYNKQKNRICRITLRLYASRVISDCQTRMDWYVVIPNADAVTMVRQKLSVRFWIGTKYK